MASEVTDIDITEADIIADLLAAYPASIKPDETWIDADGAAKVWNVGMKTAEKRLKALVESGEWEIYENYIAPNGRVRPYYRKVRE